MIQVDSSKHGIDAAPLQEGRPVEYALRALPSSERNWAHADRGRMKPYLLCMAYRDLTSIAMADL